MSSLVIEPHPTAYDHDGKSFIRHSVPLDESAYVCDDYFCLFKPRIHSDAALADKGSWQCQVDFLEANGPADADRNEGHHSYAVGCINSQVGNFTALCAVESIPERLELITYMVEYAYIHDDGECLNVNVFSQWTSI